MHEGLPKLLAGRLVDQGRGEVHGIARDAFPRQPHGFGLQAAGRRPLGPCDELRHGSGSAVRPVEPLLGRIARHPGLDPSNRPRQDGHRHGMRTAPRGAQVPQGVGVEVRHARGLQQADRGLDGRREISVRWRPSKHAEQRATHLLGRRAGGRLSTNRSDDRLQRGGRSGPREAHAPPRNLLQLTQVRPRPSNQIRLRHTQRVGLVAGEVVVRVAKQALGKRGSDVPVYGGVHHHGAQRAGELLSRLVVEPGLEQPGHEAARIDLRRTGVLHDGLGAREHRRDHGGTVVVRVGGSR